MVTMVTKVYKVLCYTPAVPDTHCTGMFHLLSLQEEGLWAQVPQSDRRSRLSGNSRIWRVPPGIRCQGRLHQKPRQTYPFWVFSARFRDFFLSSLTPLESFWSQSYESSWNVHEFSDHWHLRYTNKRRFSNKFRENKEMSHVSIDTYKMCRRLIL